jgi:hypothetical protein
MFHLIESGLACRVIADKRCAMCQPNRRFDPLGEVKN